MAYSFFKRSRVSVMFKKQAASSAAKNLQFFVCIDDSVNLERTERRRICLLGAPVLWKKSSEGR